MIRSRHRTGGVRAAAASLAGLLVLLWAPSAAADEPTAPLVFPFSGDHRIHALEGGGICEMVMLDGAPVERCLTLDLDLDARGRYEGTATLTYEGDGIDGMLVGRLRGRQKERRGITSFDLKSRLKGELVLPVVDEVRAKGKLRCGGMISAGGALDGVCEFQLKRPGSRHERDEIPLPADVIGGDWTLTIINLRPLGNGRFEGEATDSFGFGYDVRGKYNERKDTSKLKVRGRRGTLGRGARVDLRKLESTGPSEGTARARYKLLGAKGRSQTTALDPS